jgi:N-acetylglutamate synthase/N-acetylornithine aminotransferase
MKKLLLLTIVAISGMLNAQNGPKGKLSTQEKADKLTAKMKTELALTAEQESQVRSANLEFITKNESLTKENKVERKNNRKDHQSKLNSILTKEQQEKAKSLMKENQKKRRENRK